MIDEFRGCEIDTRIGRADALQHRIDAGIHRGLANALDLITTQIGLRGAFDQIRALDAEQLAEVLPQRRSDAPQQLLEWRDVRTDLAERIRHRGGNCYMRIGQRPVEIEEDVIEAQSYFTTKLEPTEDFARKLSKKTRSNPARLTRSVPRSPT